MVDTKLKCKGVQDSGMEPTGPCFADSYLLSRLLNRHPVKVNSLNQFSFLFRQISQQFPYDLLQFGLFGNI